MADSDVKGPHQEVSTQTDISSSEDNAGTTSGVDTESEKEMSSPQDAAKKDIIPPKRPAVVAKRPSAVTAPSATKPSTTPTTPRTTGGLSKPPTRPAASVSTARKPAGSSTGSASAGASHRASASVSSADERKPSTTASRRTSVAPSASASSSSKPATTAAAARKPATSTLTSAPAARHATSATTPKISTAPKPSGTNGTASARSTASATRPAVGSAASDPKKRLSTAAGSVGASTKAPMRPTTSASAPTKEFEQLKAKLEVSEARVEELKAEIQVSQKKLLAMGQKLEDESTAVTEAQNQIREQHDGLIEKLRAEHKITIETLETKLQEAKAAHESDRLALDTGASDAAAAIENERSKHAAALAAMNAELEGTKEVNASEMSKKEGEIADLTSKLNEASIASSELKSLQTEHENRAKDLEAELASSRAQHAASLEDLKKSMTNEHEAALTALSLSHQAELERRISDSTKSYEARLKELIDQHESEKGNLKRNLEDAVSSHAALVAANKESSESGLKEHVASIARLEAELTTLKSSSKEDQKALASAKKELATITPKLDLAEKSLAALSEKYEVLQAKNVEGEEALVAANEEALKAKQEVVSLQKMMDAFDEESKSKDDMYNKTKAELAATTKSLDDLNKELPLIQEKHRKELETVSADYEKEIAALEGNSGFKDKYEQLRTEHEELVKSRAEAIENYTTSSNKLKQDHSAALELLKNNDLAHEKALEALKATHAKDLDEAYDKAVVAGDSSHAADLKEIQDSQAKAIAILEEKHVTSRTSLVSEIDLRKAAEDELRAEIAKTAASIQDAHLELDAVKLDLAMEKSAKVAAQAELDAALNKKPDTTEVDFLRKELQFLKDQHEVALADVQQESTKATADHLAAKEALERLQADLDAALNQKPDTSEAEALRKDLQTLKDQHEVAITAAKQESSEATAESLSAKEALVKAQADLAAALSKKPDTSEAEHLREDLQALKDQHQAALMTAQQESAKATEEHLATKEALENAQAAATAHKEAAEAKDKISEADYKDMHDSLTQLVEEANKKAVDKEALVAELEANLKVRDAELAEAKARVDNPKTPVKSTTGLSSSRFSTEASEATAENAPELEGEHDNSSAALASVR
ncbi:MAG: hypothetical protein M1818_006074 [Claussenomyces sp. TS43310]|nr:MAG: hypothetical protein M1818_006074 [Claussenomyces sp. TS43310]